MAGRPKIYTPELGEEIAEMIATTSLSLKRIAEKCGISYFTLRSWYIDREHPFSTLYARAKELQKEHIAEEIMDIADEGVNDLMTIARGDEVYEQENKEVVNRSKLRVDARKWLLSKLDPKKYGDKLEIENKGEITVKTVTFE